MYRHLAITSHYLVSKHFSKGNSCLLSIRFLLDSLLPPAADNHECAFFLYGFSCSGYFVYTELYNMTLCDCFFFFLSCTYRNVAKVDLWYRHVSVLHSFWGWIILHCAATPHAYPFIRWWTFGVSTFWPF